MAPSSRAIVANSLVCEPWREHTELHAMALALLLSRARTCPQSPPLPGTPTSTWLGRGWLTAHYFTLYGRQRPAETQGCTAVGPRLLIRMRPLVQVQPGPRHRG